MKAKDLRERSPSNLQAEPRSLYMVVMQAWHCHWGHSPKPHTCYAVWRWAQCLPITYTMCILLSSHYISVHTWATSWQNQQNGMCAQQRLISLGIHPVWSESSLCAQCVAKDPSFLHADSWSESLLGAHAILLVFFTRRHKQGFNRKW